MFSLNIIMMYVMESCETRTRVLVDDIVEIRYLTVERCGDVTHSGLHW